MRESRFVARLLLLCVFISLLCCPLLCDAVSTRVAIGRSIYPQNLAIDPPKGYKALQRVSKEHRISFSIALKQRNVDTLERRFWEISNPRHTDYGQYYSNEELAALLSPPSESRAVVVEWLRSNDINDIESVFTGDFLKVKGAATNVEKLLQTTLFHFQHNQSGRTIVRAATQVTVPKAIAEKIDFIGGLYRFPSDFTSGVKLNPHYADDFKTANRITASVRAPKEPTSTAPVFVSGVEGDRQLSVVVKPVCRGNQFSFNAQSPCADFLPAVQSLRFELSIPNNAPQSLTMPVFNSFTGKSNCFTDVDKSVSCRFTLEQGLVNYVPITVKVTSQYEDGSESESATAPRAAYLSIWTTPTNIHQFYGVNYLRGTNHNNRMSVSGFLGEYYSRADLAKFLDDTGLTRQSVARVIGPNIESMPGSEASLDIEYIMAVGLNVSTWFWSVSGGDEEHEPFLEWLMQLTNTSDSEIPWVHSLSYGDIEHGYDAATLSRLNVEFMKAGARGMSLLFSSMDDGTGAQFARTDQSYCEPFTPTFPASSPYVTSVGATQYSTHATPHCTQTLSAKRGAAVFDLRIDCSETKEIACSSDTGGVITTGGGFSRQFPTPHYQRDFVEKYLKTMKTIGKLPRSSLFNATGRAYPDVATIGHNFLVVLEGKTIPIHGTSASTPVFAGMIALLNDIRMNNGLKPLGFLNPWLYQTAAENADAFYDVTVGNNNCTAAYWPQPLICCDGFVAAPGWDPLTGIGSPRFDVLKTIIERSLITEDPYSEITVFGLLTGVAVMIIMLALLQSCVYNRTVRYYY